MGTIELNRKEVNDYIVIKYMGSNYAFIKGAWYLLMDYSFKTTVTGHSISMPKVVGELNYHLSKKAVL